MPWWIPAAIAGGASLIGNVMGSSNTRDTNRTNMQIAQMNNQWSEKMMEKQNLYNIDQWNREKQFSLEQREYDSAPQQAQRFRDAGLNPSLVMGGGNAGSAASTPSGNSVGLPSPSQATMQPFIPNFDGIGSAINNAMMLDAQRKQMSAETEWYKTQSTVAAAESAERVKDWKLRNEMSELTKDLTISIKNEQYLKAVQDRLGAEKQQKLVDQQTYYQQLVNKGLPERLSKEVALMASQIKLNEWNSDVQVGKLIEAIKKRGINLSKWEEKLIFGALTLASVIK